MNKTFYLAFFSVLFCYSAIYGQRNCGTMDHLHESLQSNPQQQENLDRLEKFTTEYTRDFNNKEISGGVITIPTVVHVLYASNAQNISDAQINSQIAVLNDDFRRNNADASNTPGDFLPVAADTEIQFCLTKITRTSTSVSQHGTNDSMKFNSSGGKDVENPTTSLNIWVCGIGGGILGYAQFPGGSANTDGVVVDYRYFGTTGTATAPFDLGRTTTHEVGHWLNLRHIWGDGGCNVDDFVSDTPSAGGPNYTGSPCNYPGPNSCKPKGKPGQDDDYDMFQNYMDYSDDGCMNLFTVGQASRMWAAINNSRPGLINASCDGTAPPPPPAQEICDNNIDDDGDGQVDCADGDCANDAACDTTPPPPPGGCDAPTGLSHERRKGGKEARLSWNAVSGANNYTIEVYNSSGSLIASGNVSGTSATVTGVTKNAAYTWRAKANCSSGSSDWANSSFNARLSGDFSAEELTVSPNPASNQTYLQWDLPSSKAIGVFEISDDDAVSSNYTVQLISSAGTVIKTVQTNDTELTLDITNTNPGIYIIKVQDDKNGNVAIKKLLVE